LSCVLSRQVLMGFFIWAFSDCHRFPGGMPKVIA
jgi:hypothetical protein